MIRRIQTIHKTLNRSIFVGERYERNLHNIAISAVIIVVMGVVMTALNLVQKQYLTSLSPFVFIITGTISCISTMKLHSRRLAIGATMLAVVIVLTLDVLYLDNGFAYLWTLMVPISVSYMFSVKMGVWISVYFEALFVALFYTPLRRLVEGHFSEVVTARFPLLFFFIALITLFVMYQYHKSVLAELEYAERLNAEVERQTKLAVEQTRLAVEQSKVATERADQLERLSEEMVETLARTIVAKDEYTKGHSFRVSEYAVALARRLGWSEKELFALRREALLHDIGKIGVPDAVLQKPGKLTPEEFALVQAHTTTGKNILEGLEGMSSAAEVAAYHHERYDGKGYPSGLSGKSIPEHARVISIADAYDAMHSDRVYRKALPADVIRNELKTGCGKQFDPDFLPVFLEMCEHGEV